MSQEINEEINIIANVCTGMDYRILYIWFFECVQTSLSSSNFGLHGNHQFLEAGTLISCSIICNGNKKCVRNFSRNPEGKRSF